MSRTINKLGDLGMSEIMSYTLPCGISKEHLLEVAHLDHVSPLAKEFVHSESFRLSEKNEGKLAILEFSFAPSTDVVLRSLSLGGYNTPREEDALHLASCALSFTKPIVFLHLDNVWRVPGSREQICALNLSEDRKRLYTIWRNNNWGERYLFAARSAVTTS